jgi:hypothetical protein
MKKVPDALGTAENESGRAKQEKETRHPRYRRNCVKERKTCKRDPTTSVPPKMSPGSKTLKWDPTPSVPLKMSPESKT